MSTTPTLDMGYGTLYPFYITLQLNEWLVMLFLLGEEAEASPSIANTLWRV